MLTLFETQKVFLKVWKRKKKINLKTARKYAYLVSRQIQDTIDKQESS